MAPESTEFTFKMPVSGPTYRGRTSILDSERVWRLMPDALVREGVPDRRILYGDIRRIWMFGVPGLSYYGSRFTPAGGTCRVTPTLGRSVSISSTHFLGLGRFEDRSQAWRPFVDALIRHAVAANPDLVIRMGWPFWLWTIWLLILLGTVALITGAFVGFIIGASSIGSALWSGDHAGHSFGDAMDALFMLIAALSFGLTIPGFFRVLKNERPRTIKDPGRTPESR